MESKKPLNLFISYSHRDDKHIEDFIKHLSPLKDKLLIEIWYDKYITGGDSLFDFIDNKIEDANIICLMISKNYLSSPSCSEERKKAIELKKTCGTSVIPIILEPCLWDQCEDLKNILAFPTDGIPIVKFANNDEGWVDVVRGINKKIEQLNLIRDLKVSDKFLSFLKNANIFTCAHSQKKELVLEDFYVYPELEKYNSEIEFETIIDSDSLILEMNQNSKLLIIGEDQSGKTSLCKMLFTKFKNYGLIPIYITDDNNFKGRITNKIQLAMNEQYENNGINIDNIEKDCFVIIIDDFHHAKNKEKHIIDLSEYKKQFIFVDDLFSLNIKNENIIKQYYRYKIKQLKPSLRYKLVEKWNSNNHDDELNLYGNCEYKAIDSLTHFVDHTLGKVISNGIMPAYPFFILSVLISHETISKPLNQEITDQGYCYQALIYIYLKKAGVSNKDLDAYLNFLTELSFRVYHNENNLLSKEEMDCFFKKYEEKFYLPIEKNKMLGLLIKYGILRLDGFSFYSFTYPYLFYFFVAKFIAENLEEHKEMVIDLINGLQKNDNAYITIFLAHHSKNSFIIENLLEQTQNFYKQFTPATLNKEEITFFEKKMDDIVKEKILPRTLTPEILRSKNIEHQDLLEEHKNNLSNIELNSELDDEFSLNFRRSIKTVEVIGRILTNRAGSLEKSVLENLFDKAFSVYLRLLSLMLSIVNSDIGQTEVIAFLKESLLKCKQEKLMDFKDNNINQYAEKIFLNLIFFSIYGLLTKAIHSLGSENLSMIAEKICTAKGTPAAFIVYHGILMHYEKKFDIEKIGIFLKEKEWPEFAKRILRFKSISHCLLHEFTYKEKQQIESILGISKARLSSKASNQ